MANTYRSYLPELDLLLPPSVRDWLPEKHLAYFVSDVVDQLGLSAIESVYAEAIRHQSRQKPGKVLADSGYCSEKVCSSWRGSGSQGS